jgi:hypothetical protein
MQEDEMATDVTMLQNAKVSFKFIEIFTNNCFPKSI